mmetsp:Transcript_31964/g.62887  ORF Transcript_31964/g.62887 Transcript_31964/m.62887 type:complete len:219 (-) Transcript_31964:338-994(-)
MDRVVSGSRMAALLVVTHAMGPAAARSPLVVTILASRARHKRIRQAPVGTRSAPASLAKGHKSPRPCQPSARRSTAPSTSTPPAAVRMIGTSTAHGVHLVPLQSLTRAGWPVVTSRRMEDSVAFTSTPRTPNWVMLARRSCLRHPPTLCGRRVSLLKSLGQSKPTMRAAICTDSHQQMVRSQRRSSTRSHLSLWGSKVSGGVVARSTVGESCSLMGLT